MTSERNGKCQAQLPSRLTRSVRPENGDSTCDRPLPCPDHPAVAPEPVAAETQPERPDDSGIYDDETLETIICESIERMPDPITRRDVRWIFGQLAELRARLAASEERERKLLAALGECVDAVPTSWLDSLLTGPDKVVRDGHTYDGHDIEALFRGVKKRITGIRDVALLAEEHKP